MPLFTKPFLFFLWLVLLCAGCLVPNVFLSLIATPTWRVTQEDENPVRFELPEVTISAETARRVVPEFLPTQDSTDQLGATHTILQPEINKKQDQHETLQSKQQTSITDARMNLLYIVADDLRPQLEPYGKPAITPNLARLASRGFVFEKAYAQVTVCNPSRNSFLSGRKPDVAKVWHFEDTIPASWSSIPKSFGNNGYRVVGHGKVWHWGEGPGTQWKDVLAVTGAPYFPTSSELQGRVLDFERDQPRTVTSVPANERLFAPANEFRDVQFTDRALASLDRLVRDREEGVQTDPFFLSIGLHQPHEPYYFPEEFWILYDGLLNDTFPPVPLPPLGSPAYALGDVQPVINLMHDDPSGEAYCETSDSNCSLETIRGQIGSFVSNLQPTRKNQFRDIPRREPMPKGVQNELLRGYSASITFMDQQVGRLLDKLDDLMISSRTIVVFHADHGFSIGDHGQWGKRSLYEHDSRVPLIIADPRASHSHGKSSKAIVELVDVYPTMAHLAGIMNSQRIIRGFTGPPLSGFSLKEIIYGSSKNGRTAAITQFSRCPLRGSTDYRTHTRSAIDFGCAAELTGRDTKLASSSMVLMGYSLRSRNWRYTAWLLWDQRKRTPVWRYPPYGEELFDHRNDHETKDFDAFEAVNLATQKDTMSIRWKLFNALKYLVEGDVGGELAGGRGTDMTELSRLGIESWEENLPGHGPLPSEIITLLNKIDLLPPPFHENACGKDKKSSVAGIVSNITATNAGLGDVKWPLCDNQSLEEEQRMRVGDTVEVLQGYNKAEWIKYRVNEVLPRWTLRDEKGSALVLSEIGNQQQGKVRREVYVPSRLWPEGDDSVVYRRAAQ